MGPNTTILTNRDIALTDVDRTSSVEVLKPFCVICYIFFFRYKMSKMAIWPNMFVIYAIKTFQIRAVSR